MPFFSVIVPVYNTEKDLACCVDSVLGQTDPDFELILVDDGSTDSSGAICDAYALRDPRVKAIHKQNGGLTSARKCGMEASTGTYVAVVDSDDAVDPAYLESARSILQNENVDMIVFGFDMCEGSKKTRSLNAAAPGRYEGEALIELRKTYLFDEERLYPNSGSLTYTLWSKVMRRTLYEICQSEIRDHVKFGEDLLVSTKLLKRCSSVYVSDQVFYRYRISETSMCRKFEMNKFSHYEDTVIAMIPEYRDEPVKIEYFACTNLLALTMQLRSVSDRYRSFKAAMRSTYVYSHLWDYARRFHKKNGNRKLRIKFSLLRNRRFLLLYLLSGLK